MVSRVHDLNCLILPIRSRIMPALDSNIPAKLSLADRIADLPCVQVVDHDPNSSERRVDVMLGETLTPLRKQRLPTMFCAIGGENIVVYGLNDADRHQVLSRRWGRLHGKGVLLFMPRDGDELEIVWRILHRAYQALLSAEAPAHAVRRSAVYELPRFSRTNLQ